MHQGPKTLKCGELYDSKIPWQKRFMKGLKNIYIIFMEFSTDGEGGVSPNLSNTYFFTKKNVKQKQTSIMELRGLQYGRKLKCSNSAKIRVRNYWYHTKCVSG